MTAWPTQTAIIAATHGSTARDAERRANLAAVENALQFSLAVMIDSAQGRRLPVHATRNRVTAACIAAHRAIGA